LWAAQFIWATGFVAHASTVEPLLSVEGLAGFELASSAPMDGLSNFETAAGSPIEEQTATPRKSYNSKLIQRIQQGLAEQGFYLGVIDGQFGPKTEAAIRAYQASAELPVNGEPSDQLAIDLETGGKVGQLLNRLEKSRKTATEQAREALLAQPETRALLEGGESDVTAPHDAKACMARPNPRCLLVEASIFAGDIDKPEMRDWALGEILTAQAKAGLANDALATTRRIHDPRLIVVALREIAKAQAAAGNTADALAALEIIPDLMQQIEAYVSIAEIQAEMGQTDAAAATAVHLIDYLQRVDSPLVKITYRTRIAVILHNIGRTDDAAQHIRACEALLTSIRDIDDHNEAQRYIAAAYAESGQPTKAMEILKTVKAGANDVPVLIAAATKLAQAGDADQALVTADSIEAVRYRALVLARIASYQAGAGDLESASTSLDKAVEAARLIKFPFAKAYAFSRIALALNDVGISSGNDADLLNRAFETAHLITDDRLKAHIFWTIADERRRADDEAGAVLAKNKAVAATADIISPFSRVWMLCDIAIERAQGQDMDAAWTAFDEAMDEAKTITNPWGRARAFGKVAGTMTTLTDRAAEIAKR
jgi:peptidoglycan hydrolase-like protein with peptidoglycan-binding domain